jgi:hypothetical protein
MLLAASPEAKIFMKQGLGPMDLASKFKMIVLEITLPNDIVEAVQKEVTKGSYFMKGNSKELEGHALCVHILERKEGCVDQYLVALEDFGTEQ